MAKYLKILLFLLLSVTLHGLANAFSSEKSVENDEYVYVHTQSQSQELSTAQLPYLPEGEIASAAQTYQLNTSRLQRIYFIEYSLTLKALAQKLSLREALLMQHWGKVYDTTTAYNCHPAIEYYVFALRRIII